MKRSIAFGASAVSISLSASAIAFAQGAPPNIPKVEWAKAVVVTDGGSVYSEPDFDAKVADYLSVKSPVWASRTAVAGKGGLGLFHRVHWAGKNGFMADVDIRIVEMPDTPPADTRPAGAPTKRKQRVKSKALEEEEPSHKEKDPYYFTRRIGASIGRVKFSEKFEGKTMRAMMNFFGLRMTGPGVLFDGPPLDFNLMVTFEKPAYYKAFTRSASGFTVFGNTDFIVPVMQQDDWDVTLALGLMYVYTNYKVTISNSKFDSQEFRLGIDGGLGGGFRFGPRKAHSLRFDVKGYVEKTYYYGHFLTYQIEY